MSKPSRLGQPTALDDLLLYRLSRLLGTAGSMVTRLCEGRFGITRREWRVLALLAQDEGLLSSQLAERAQLYLEGHHLAGRQEAVAARNTAR